VRIRCTVTDAEGALLCADWLHTDDVNLRSLANAGHVTRLLRTSNVVPELGQKLTVWIEAD